MWFKKHKHKHYFDTSLYNIPMENETNYIVTKCKCGETKIERVHRKSISYMKFIKIIT
jgi:hypothetical protein